MLKIQNFSAGVEKKDIISAINLHIKPGEIHVVMGPNGSGKSTLAHSIMGSPVYDAHGGKILFGDEEIQEMSPDQRSHKGVFLVFQQPRTVKGVNNKNYLHTIVKSKILGENHLSLSEARKNKDLRKKLSLVTFKKNLVAQLPELEFKEEFMERSLNEGFSGGEKK
ncbi:ATP-binding cassette domain-containing protein, partial [Candidatus Peregrinibacteria bacterium]|nr:ATP-binding cassette domain-containing protein [Candidatus Peregrinibacteria bacterium]